MIEFLVFIAGGVFGLLADRLWMRVENRTRLSFSMGFWDGYLAGFDGPIGRGLMFTITNEGNADIPDFEILLWHRDRGTYLFFNSEQSGPLIPSQQREYRAVLFRSLGPSDAPKPQSDIEGWITGARDGQQPKSPDDLKDFYLVFRVKNSTKKLFQSEPSGTALAKMIAKTLQSGEWAGYTWEDNLVITGKSISKCAQLLHRIERLIGLRQKLPADMPGMERKTRP